ncbi:hypothetical protein, conserved, partial [Entamoeba dispar SAW760]
GSLHFGERWVYFYYLLPWGRSEDVRLPNRIGVGESLHYLIEIHPSESFLKWFHGFGMGRGLLSISEICKGLYRLTQFRLLSFVFFISFNIILFSIHLFILIYTFILLFHVQSFSLVESDRCIFICLLYFKIIHVLLFLIFLFFLFFTSLFFFILFSLFFSFFYFCFYSFILYIFFYFIIMSLITLITLLFLFKFYPSFYLNNHLMYLYFFLFYFF